MSETPHLSPVGLRHILRASIVRAACLGVGISVVLWVLAPKRPDTHFLAFLEPVVSIFTVFVLLTAAFGLWWAGVHNRMILCFGPFFPEFGGASRIVEAAVPAERFASDFREVISSEFGKRLVSSEIIPGGQASCRLRIWVYRFDVVTKRIGDGRWSISVRRLDLGIALRMALFDAGALQVLASILLVGVRNGLIKDDFPRDIPIDRALRDLEGLPC